ncbi:MAG: proton-conducting transporter membrane subunit, partial [Ilumatobacter sp.]
MILFALVTVPLLAGATTWIVGDRRLGVGSVVALGGVTATLVAAIVAALGQPTRDLDWGAGLTLVFEVDPIARGPLVLVPFVALAVVGYASGYGEQHGRSRLLGLLTIFVAVMELLLIAGDLLTLIVGWELVGLVSWALIAHHWRDDAPADAAHAFLVTRAGDLGLFLSAGAVFATTGSLRFSTFASFVDGGGPAVHVFVGGIVLAAFTKSAQVPFSPWLFSVMSGPTPASALLHSATMVAAGAYLLARLQPVLDPIAWFAPVAIGVGLTTALAGSVVAAVQSEPKKLLAASTSAHYGFMVVAVGSGYPAVAIAHLIAHGLFKALLFITAGVAIDAAGSPRFENMALGRSHRITAGLATVGAVALAGVPPLGGAWTKEAVVAAASHEAVWIGVLVVAAGVGSAFYATRFHLLAFGPPTGDSAESADFDSTGDRGRSTPALIILAAATVGLSLLWLPWGESRLRKVTGGEFVGSRLWEFAISMVTIAAGAGAGFVLQRRHRLLEPFGFRSSAVPDWFGIAAATKVGIVDPVLTLARSAARFDDRVVDAGARSVAGFASRSSSVLARCDDRVVDAGVRGVAGFASRSSNVLARTDDRVVDAGVRGTARATAWFSLLLDRFAEF